MNVPIRSLFAALMIATMPGLVPNASAHQGHTHQHDTKTDRAADSSAERSSPHERTWTLSSAQPSVNASLLFEKDGQVKLERRDGSVITVPTSVLAETNRKWLEQRQLYLRRLNTEANMQLVVFQADGRQRTETPKPSIAKHFEPFKKKVGLRWDDRFLYVESNGMPDHDMMVGITTWQQQVPLPQPFTGSNAWRIPLHPMPARNPMSAKEGFFIGAIAMAVNGVPIFNPIKTGGRVDTFLAGELDKWGGHCGKADDYHYHIAPVHLEKIVGKGNPIGVALDGYPIFGYEDADGSKPILDWLNGHKDADGNYHYHATTTYPYVNGGFYGEVLEVNGHVEPQARGQHLRGDSRTPLRGAKVTGFDSPNPGSYRVEYEVHGELRSIDYKVADNGTAVFQYTDPSGTESKTYVPRQRGKGVRPGNESGQRGNRRRPPNGDRGRGGRPQQDRRPEDRRPPSDSIPRGSDSGEGPRQPWIVNHATEIDLNQDGIISRDEMIGESEKAFRGYDKNNDSKLSEFELSGRGGVRSAMGGFLRMHAEELDRNQDGVITRKEVVDHTTRMFSRMDENSDGKVTKTEMESSRRTGPGDSRGDARAFLLFP